MAFKIDFAALVGNHTNLDSNPCSGKAKITETGDLPYNDRYGNLNVRTVAKCEVCSRIWESNVVLNPTVIVSGTRKDRYSGVETTTNVVFQRYQRHDGYDILSIISGGVTGYESWRLEGFNWERALASGITACAGTKDVWDELFIPAASIQIVFNTLIKKIDQKTDPNNEIS